MRHDNGYWSSYLVGALLGLTLLLTFVIAGWGLGASSAFSIIAGVSVNEISPGYASGLTYFSNVLERTSPLKSWIILEIAGVFIGGFVGAAIGRKMKLQFDRGKGVRVTTRIVTALSGGMLIGFAARLARGCTSGVALSGGAQLAIAGWIFVISMFASGFVVAAIFRRFWS